MLTDKTLLVCAITFATACSGCGAGSGGSAQAQTVTVAQGIEQLVKSGAMPQLDTSSSLLGTDADGNGVRDDIDAYISSLPDTTVQKRALTQDAAAINATLNVDTANQTALNQTATSVMRGIDCAYVKYSSDSVTRSIRLADLEKFTINTRTRFLEYQKFNKAMSGSSLPSPPKGSVCDN